MRYDISHTHTFSHKKEKKDGIMAKIKLSYCLLLITSLTMIVSCSNTEEIIKENKSKIQTSTSINNFTLSPTITIPSSIDNSNNNSENISFSNTSESLQNNTNSKSIKNLGTNKYPNSVPLYLQDVWLCQKNEINIQDFSTDSKDNLTCQVSIEYTEKEVIISANGIPNHSIESGVGCCASNQNSTWYIPLFPEEAISKTMAPDRGPVAVTVTGVAIYGPEEGPGGDAVALEYEYFVEDRQPIDLGICGGHSGPGGEYHYHFDSNCIHWHADVSSTSVEGWLNGYSQTAPILNKLNIKEISSDNKYHSPIIGFAFDGYPIYGSLGWDENETVKEITSSYRLKEGTNGYNGIEDYEYIDGLGDLDECNGRLSPTPHSPEGIYHYHTTLRNGNGDLGFPYFLLCYHGIPNEINFSAGQGQRPNQIQGQVLGQGQRPDLANAASILKITENKLKEALGPPPPDFQSAANALGISIEELQSALSANP